MSSDKNSDPYYLITFKCNFHNKLIINYELVKATNNKEHESNEQDCVHKEVNVGTSRGRGRGKGKDRKRGKKRSRGRGGVKGKGKDNNKKMQNSDIDTELQMLKCFIFNPIQNVQPLHKEYITLSHKY
ncbi:5024_t:CDS:1 [Cetraspora pellucida]|uniref:5024_t:CDS:1 n=1 Tax=Cetraspora pellucida TaxID=1433469 RepID=A0A9N9NQ74_9GLOM|nr:5024_t:CDS:1 [Cetraspora pellucida]